MPLANILWGSLSVRPRKKIFSKFQISNTYRCICWFPHHHSNCRACGRPDHLKCTCSDRRYCPTRQRHNPTNHFHPHNKYRNNRGARCPNRKYSRPENYHIRLFTNTLPWQCYEALCFHTSRYHGH